MPVSSRPTTRQTIFLRSLAKAPPGQFDWPSPIILRRWLRRPTFLRALDSLRQTLHFTSDLFLAYSAASAAHSLLPSDPENPKPKPEDQKPHIEVLRLSHLRQRFPSAAPKPTQRPPLSPTDQAVHQRYMQLLKFVHPDSNAREALEFFASRSITDPLTSAPSPFTNPQFPDPRTPNPEP